MACYGKNFNRKPTRSSAYFTKRIVMQYLFFLSTTYGRADMHRTDVKGLLSVIRAQLTDPW